MQPGIANEITLKTGTCVGSRHRRQETRRSGQLGQILRLKKNEECEQKDTLYDSTYVRYLK